MMKVTFFKVLALGLLPLALISGPADAAGRSGCPAFNSSMVDAAALASRISGSLPGVFVDGFAEDEPETPLIICQFGFSSSFSGVRGAFAVRVGVTEDGMQAELSGFHDTDFEERTLLETFITNLTIGQLHACRAEVLQSFVWNQYCAPMLE